MRFFKPSEYTLKCSIELEELGELGYHLISNEMFFVVEDNVRTFTFINKVGIIETWFKHDGLPEQTYIEIE
jgi:hypothetical protein